MDSADSSAKKALPIGLAHKVKLKRDIPEGRTVSWDDVEYDANSEAVKIRREMEAIFGAVDQQRQEKALVADCSKNIVRR
jgi:predicted homoserine dehydrogenase-like protein